MKRRRFLINFATALASSTALFTALFTNPKSVMSQPIYHTCRKSSMSPEFLTLFLCGDVMTGRGIDQVMPHPS
ncbi:MAG: poly-gamma-glutamate biosynthesis protein, partial [Gammaproteobacteria bacterium]